MSFGSSNPPWQRNTLGNTGQQNAIANLQSQMMNTNFVGFQNLAMSNQQQQNNLALIPQLGGNMSQMNNTNQMFANHQTIQYPSRQGLNPNAFSTVQNSQQILHHQAQSQPQQAPNNMTGQMCNSAAFTKQWNTVVQQMNATSQSHGMNVRSNTNQSQLQHSGQPTQQQQQSSRNFGYNASSQSQNSYASNFERASNSVRSSNHSSRQSPPARRSSPDRSNRREDEERKRRKERER